MKTIARANNIFKHRWGKFCRSLKPWLSLLFDPIVVYSMGKVGSMSVYASLQSLGLPNPIYHLHFLSWPYIREVEAYRLGLGLPTPQLEESKQLRAFADKTWGQFRWKIISLVREPVVRNISSLFQTLDRHQHLKGLDGEHLAKEASNFLKHYFASFSETNDYDCNWFNRELKEVFGLDVYAFEFDRQAGFQVYQAKYADILVMRLENLSNCYQQAVGELLDRNELTLQKANIGSEKNYKEAYKQVLESISVSESALNQIYSSRHVTHFYTAKEIESFKSRWMNNH